MHVRSSQQEVLGQIYLTSKLKTIATKKREMKGKVVEEGGWDICIALFNHHVKNRLSIYTRIEPCYLRILEHLFQAL